MSGIVSTQSMLSRIKFSVSRPGADRVHHISPEDVRVLLSRLPPDLWQQLGAVHFNDRSVGARRLGYARPESKEISMCALPPRISLTRFLRAPQTPQKFGAMPGQKWPTVATRRFLLYSVFLHELGHLHPVPRRRSRRLSHPREKLAQQFAVKWCNWLWSHPFDHPDPAHNPPVLAECLPSSAL
jgi:hypothetical protein